jgi:cytochrome b561
VKTGYSRLQIILHWIIVALVALQFFTGPSMVKLLHEITSAQPMPLPFADQVSEAWHMAAGLTTLFLAVVLLLMRGGRGTPLPAGTPPVLGKAALWTHRALYTVLVVLPLFGMAAAAGVTVAAAIHVALTRLLLALTALHIAGALWHLVVRRDGVMRGIIIPRREG